MPWSLERTGSVLSVDLRTPFDDLEAILDDIREELPPDARTVVVRSDLAECSSDEAFVVHLLCQLLVQEGIIVRSVST